MDYRELISRYGILVVLVAALALRLYGIDWDDGYDWTPHPDERAILFKVADLSFPAPGDLLDAEQSPWNPRWFNYGSFPLYLLKVVSFFAELVPGLDSDDLRTTGRVLSTLADIGTIALVYALGTMVWSRKVGLLAALLVALAVIHIQLSHFFAVDTLLALFATAALYFLVRVARHGRPLDSALGGLFIGLALATKNSVIPILGAFVVAHVIYALGLVRNGDGHDGWEVDRLVEGVSGALIGGGVIVLAFVVAQPYAILDWSRFYGDFVEQSEMVRRIRDYPYTRQYVDSTPYLYQIWQLATWGLGWPLGVVVWGGLLYAAVRGLRAVWAAAYLVAGFGVPIAVLLLSNSFVGIAVSSTIALVSLIVTIPARRPDTRIDAVLLSWVAPYLFITGAFDVKFLRYLLPVTPVLILIGSRMMLSAWEGLSVPALRRTAATVIAVVVGATGLYALAYSNVYAEAHPAVRGSEWIRDNVSKVHLVLKEHWEEGLPNLHGYRIEELPMYEPDQKAKLDKMSRLLADGEVLVFYSNRLYGTVARLENRYPVSREYYRLLFSGELGYELAAEFTANPGLFGLDIVDDTFSRPGLPVPVGSSPGPTGLSVNLGYADESFSVYDHPRVMIFRNESELDAETISQRILSAAGDFPRPRVALAEDPRTVSPLAPGKQLMLSREQTEARRSGGTWTDIVGDAWPLSRFPIVGWLFVVQAFGLLAFPLSFVVFRPLRERGWLFAKGLGLLLVALVAWLLASLELVAFGRLGIGIGVLALTALSGVILVAYRGSILRYIRRRWRTIALAEIVFLIAFFAFVAVRMANPDLWHPYRGGEKPMDMAYLNAVVRSIHMPPYDPWFAGGYLNYYYWGQFVLAVLIHATGIVPEVAINLAVPLFFALTAAFSFSVVYNLAAAWIRTGESNRLPPSAAGIAGALFVVVLGNFDGAIQIGEGVWRAVVEGLPFGEFDFWRSSRMMAPDPPGHEITEFPFFTFLFADPHAHLFALPFTLLAIGLSAAIVLRMARPRSLRSVWSPNNMARVVLLGLVLGALRVINTWDFPTYLLFGAAAIALGEYLAQGGISAVVLVRSAVKILILYAVGYLAFLPFHLNYETFFNSVESTTNTTTVWQFLTIHGLFVFVVGSFCVWQLRDLFGRVVPLVRGFVPLAGVSAPSLAVSAPIDRVQIGAGRTLAAIVAIVLFGYLLTALTSGFNWTMVVFSGALLLLVLAVARRALRDGGPVTALVCLLAATGLALAIGLDFLRVEGDIDRMNTVFKFYLQVWVLLALAAAFCAWRLGGSVVLAAGRVRWYGVAWASALAVLVLSAAVYPALGTRDRLRDRYDGNVTPLTLDGLAYAQGSVYRDPKGAIDLDADFEGMRWLRENVAGSPVVLEANTPTYRWGGRVSIYTGLPSVVGWKWHQEQQRWGSRREVARRISEVDRIYSTTDVAEAFDLLRKYDVKYVYVGQLEKVYYSDEGIAKFNRSMRSLLNPVFEGDQVTIYEVVG